MMSYKKNVYEPWTDNQLAALKAMDEAGYTRARIAAKLNVLFGTSRSRNSVIGKINRMKQGEK